MRDEASWFYCLPHFMAFVIYAWGLGLWDGGLCIPNLFCFRIAFEYNEHSLSSQIFPLPLCHLLYHSQTVLQPPTLDPTAAHRSESGISSPSVPSTGKPPPTGAENAHSALYSETRNCIYLYHEHAGGQIHTTNSLLFFDSLLSSLQNLHVCLFAVRDCYNRLCPLSACVYVYINIRLLCLFKCTVHVLITSILFTPVLPLCTKTFGRYRDSTTAKDVSISSETK